MPRHRHAMPFGATVRPEGGVLFRLWAPGDVRLTLRVDGDRHDAPRDAEGWRSVAVPTAGAGSRYEWLLSTPDGGEIAMPDPASRANPQGVHAPSVVVDPEAFAWADRPWRARPWHESVVYELHVGAFTAEGTFAAAIDRLPDLAATGVTTVELMPLSSFPGRFGWGYDGVLPFAPHAAYGTPDDLKRFVQAAHDAGLAVMVDVVYNHFGPDGNHLGAYAPPFFTERHHTPWGAALNFEGSEGRVVRDFIVHNALYWLEEHRVDGLRLDAVHAIVDETDPHILREIAARVREHVERHEPGRRVHLVLENEHNDACLLKGSGGPYDGQWNDDFHHALHVLLTGEHHGYYGFYADDPIARLAQVLTEGFTRRGPGTAPHAPVCLGSLLTCLHNHDQIGNRAHGERLSQLVPEAPLRLAVAMLLLAPSPPMLFMGEEHGATTPFLYFADWSGELRDAVREGRRREFAGFPAFADAALRERIPDPCDPATFERSKLDWPSFDGDASRRWHRHYRELLALRRRELWPLLGDAETCGTADATAAHTPRHRVERHGARGLEVRWQFGRRALRMQVNLSSAALRVSGRDFDGATRLHAVGEVHHDTLGPWSGRWHWEAP